MAASFAFILFAFLTLGSVVCEADTAPAISRGACSGTQRAMQRTELIFGTQRAGRAPVSEAQWRTFAVRELLPRFPDGSTLLSSLGQWRSKSGVIVRERSHILLLWHDGSAATNDRIEEVRTLFKKRFGQDSIMRIDGADCVSF